PLDDESRGLFVLQICFQKKRAVEPVKPVLIDENENSLDDAYFAGSPGKPNWWINISATRHGGAGGLSFADGHSEIKSWKDSKVLNPPSPYSSFASDPNSGDNAWLEQRESSVLQ